MVQNDYKILESSIAFLKQFSEGIIPPNINKLFQIINTKLADPSSSDGSIDPRFIIDKLYKVFPPQLKIIIKTFDESF